MLIYDLTFTDGKQCRHIVPEPQDTEEEELRITQAIFCGRLASMERIVTPPPTKLPWQQQKKGLWTLGLFVLRRLGDDEFECSWPGRQVVGDKDAISATVRLHYQEGI